MHAHCTTSFLRPFFFFLTLRSRSHFILECSKSKSTIAMKTTKTKRNQNRSPDYHGVQHAQLSRCDAMPWHAMLMSIYAHFWSALHHNSHSDFMFNWLIVSNRKIGVSACVPNLLRKLNETPRSFGIFRSFPEIDWVYGIHSISFRGMIRLKSPDFNYMINQCDACLYTRRMKK